MNCKNCGTEISEGAKFCENCGTEYIAEETATNEVTEAAQEETAATEAVQEEATAAEPVQGEEQEEVEKTPSVCQNCGAPVEEDLQFCTNCGVKLSGEQENAKNAFLSILKKVNIPVIVAIILVISLVAYAAPVIKNSVVKTFTSSESYFKYVVNNSFDDFAEDVADLYEVVKESATENVGAKGEVKLTKGDGLDDLLEDLGAEIDPEYIDWFDSVKIDYSASSYENRASADMGIKLNGEKIVSLDMVADMEEMGMYMAFPELNSTYIYTDMDPYDYNSTAMQEMKKVLKILPKENVAEDLLCRYMKCLVDGVNKVEEEKETIQAGDVSQKVTALTVTIDGDTAIESARNVLKELKKDKDIKKIIKDLSKLDDSAIDYESFVESIDSALKELEDMDGESILYEEIEFTLYADGEGKIVGIDFDYEDVQLKAYTAEKGNKFGTYLRVRASDGSVTFEGSGKMSGDKVSGDFSLKVMGVDILDISLKNLDIEKLKDGVVNGKITLKLDEDIENIAPFDYADVISELSLVIDGNSKSVENIDDDIILEYDGKECARITAQMKDAGAKKAKLPKNFVNSDDYEKMEEWSEKADMDKLIKALKKAGVPEEFTEGIESQFN